MNYHRVIIAFIGLIFALSAYGANGKRVDSLDIDFIDKLYVKEPERAYQLLGAAYRRLVETKWQSCSRDRYEYVAGNVCLHNFRYNEAFRHAMALQNMDEGGRLEIWTRGVSLQCAVEYALGDYGRLSDTFWKLRHTVNEADNEALSPGNRVYSLLECDYYQIICELRPHHVSRVLNALKKARTDMQDLQRRYPGSKANCHIFGHLLDRLEADIYLENKDYARAVPYIRKTLDALNSEQRRGGDGITDAQGYDIYRLDLIVRLGQAYAGLGQRQQALQLADKALALLSIYPHTEQAMARLLGIYNTVRTTPPKPAIALAENFVTCNMGSTAQELRRVCESLLEVYTQEGDRQKSLAMLSVLKSYGEDVTKARQSYALVSDSIHRQVTSQKKDLELSELRQWAMGIGIAFCLLSIVLLLYLHHRLVHNSHYLYRHVKKAVNRTMKQSDMPVAATVEDIRDRVSAVLSHDNLYRKPDFEASWLEKPMGMSLGEINDQLDRQHTSVADIVMELRLRYACLLLETTDYVLQYIAEEAGFNTLRTFYRQFKKKYKFTPTEYRRLSQSRRSRSLASSPASPSQSSSNEQGAI